MLTQDLTTDALYQALIERDAAFEGRAYVGVTSTGIFCRLTCPARKPKRENCAFYDSVAACLQAGFRPCKRCIPMQTAAEADPTVTRLLRAVNDDPQRSWSEADVRAFGLNAASVRRTFKRHFGMTFLAYVRLARLQRGFVALESTSRVIDAQLDAGFDSGSGFRQAFARLLGIAPRELLSDGALRADWIATPLGHMIAVADCDALHLLEFLDRRALAGELSRLQAKTGARVSIGRFSPIDQIASELERFFAGALTSFQTPVTLHGTSFTRDVWSALRTIPPGQTRSYADIARQIGKPDAVRAVARANGANQLAVIVPCHRVIGADGSLTGYGGGLWRKQKLIELEQRIAAQH
ncbi:MAG: trifunctional transcriptional activator/DNA repair protein Ada/methylated-DNA--[protein]-cysteine S-methyltransferase [Pseudomonadota bacterium]